MRYGVLFLLLSFSLGGGGLRAQVNILNARTNFALGQTLTVEGIIISDDNLGSIRYMQDETAGIAVYPGEDWSAFGFTPQPGDVVSITGTLTEYNGLLEIVDLSVVTILGTAAVPDPVDITPGQLTEDIEGQLVRIQDVSFGVEGGAFGSNQTVEFEAFGETGVLYISHYNSLAGEPIPGCEVNLIGVASQYSFDGSGGYQLLPRGVDDIAMSGSLCLTTSVSQSVISTSGFALSWSTNAPCNSVVEYGLTEALGNTAAAGCGATSHLAYLPNLQAGSIYYARGVCSLPSGEILTTATRPYATVSESSGAVHTLFNGDVMAYDTTGAFVVSPGNDLVDSIVTWINQAQHTLDVAAYNFDDPQVAEAINQAEANGVDIRWCYEGSSANLGLPLLDSSIPLLGRTDGMGLMLNTFIIADADYSNLAYVFTSSGDLTTHSLVNERNNAVVVEDQSVARAFQLEFEEMWGSQTMTPNFLAGNFGSDKTNNTPTQFVVGGHELEVYFAPSGGTIQAIQETIASAESALEFAQMLFTRNDLGAAVLEANQAPGVDVMGLIEMVNTTGSEYEFLVQNGVMVFPHPNEAFLRHKYAVLDYAYGADPLVITGSQPWSNSAELNADANTLILHQADVATAYHNEFLALSSDYLGCMDAAACNFVPTAEVEDGSCYFPNTCGSCDLAADENECGGCTDSIAVNFNAEAVWDDGGCSYFDFSCSGIGFSFWDEFDLGVYSDSDLSHPLGEEVIQAFLVHVPSTMIDPQTGVVYAIDSWNDITCSGLPLGLEWDEQETLLLPDSQYCMTYQGMPLEIGAYGST